MEQQNRNHEKNRKLLWIFLFLFGLQGLWLLKHFQILDWNSNPQESDEQFGKITEINNDLKFFVKDQNIWKKAEIQQTLFNNDRLMTSDNSTATIQLQDQSYIYMSPNSLVTLEKNVSDANSAIRLNIEKGTFIANSSSGKETQIETNLGTIQLSKESIAHFRKNIDGKTEIEIKKGQATLTDKKNQKLQLALHQVAEISIDHILNVKESDSSLSFKKLPSDKIYVQEIDRKILLSWSGNATELLVTNDQSVTRTFKIKPDQKEMHQNYEEGRYQARLVSSKGISEPLAFEVLKMKPIQVFSPKDRDRFEVKNTVQFSWADLPEAKKYTLVFIDEKTKKRFEETNSTGFFEKSFSESQELSWFIEAFDENNFLMTRSSPLKLSIGDQLLAAPKVKTIELRAPASTKKKKTSQFDNLKNDQSIGQHLTKILLKSKVLNQFLGTLFQKVEAAEDKPKSSDSVEAVFRWESVPGAKEYVIELSKTNDFRATIVSRKTIKNEFIWSNFEDGIYYWRVAASDKTNRLGLFSQSSKIVLKRTEAKDELDPESAFSEGVLIRRRPDLEKYRLPMDTKSENIFQQTPQQTFDEKRFDKKVRMDHFDFREVKDRALIHGQALNSQWILNGPDNIKTTVKSNSSIGLHLQFEKAFEWNTDSSERDAYRVSSQRSIMIDVSTLTQDWHPEENISYDTQEKLKNFQAHLLWGDGRTHLRRGFFITSIPSIKKDSQEIYHLEQTTAFGPSVLYQYYPSDNWLLSYQLGLAAASQSVSLSSHNNFNYLFWKTSWTQAFVGIGLNVDLFFVDRSFSNSFSGGLNFGFDF